MPLEAQGVVDLDAGAPTPVAGDGGTHRIEEAVADAPRRQQQIPEL